MKDGNSASVWVLDSTSMTVNLQPIQVATVDGNDVVIAGGLQPGMRIVSAGVHVLAPGQKVSIYKEKGPLALAEPAQAAMNSVANSAPESAVSPALAGASAAK